MADDDGNGESGVVFTAAETKFLLCALKNVDRGFKFNYDAVATELGYKDGSIARVRWNSINRNKIQAGAATPAGVKKTTSAKKSTPKKRKGGDTGEGDEDELGNGHSSPLKTPKKRGRKPKADGADGTGVKVKEESMEDVVETTEKESEDELAA